MRREVRHLSTLSRSIQPVAGERGIGSGYSESARRSDSREGRVAVLVQSELVSAQRDSAPRRILIVVHGFPPLQNSGAELQAYRKARWWQARGHQVRVLAADPRSAREISFGEVEEHDEVVDGIDVRRVRIAVPDATRPVAETYRNPLLATALDRQIADFHPDLIYHVSGYLFGVIPAERAHKWEIPFVLFVTDYWHICPRITLLRPNGTCCAGPGSPADCAACRLVDRAFAKRLGLRANGVWWQVAASTGRLVDRMGLAMEESGIEAFKARECEIRQSLACAALVIAESQFLGSWMQHCGVPAERLAVIRQGIEAGEFDRLRGGRPFADSSLRLLYLGQLGWHKGVDLAITAVKRLRAAGMPIELQIHGPWSDHAERLARLTDRGESDGIRFGRPLQRPEVVEALHDADVLVVPSRWYDNSPNVILEAFAAGVPVIAAGHGGMAEMVRHEVDGLLFEPGNAHSLACQIRRLLDEPDLLPQLRAGVQRPYSVDDEMALEDAAIERILRVAARRE